MSQCISGWAEEVLGFLRGGNNRSNGAWWRNDEVKEKFKKKEDVCAVVRDNTYDAKVEANKVRYKGAKKEAKKVVTQMKNNAFEKFYQKLMT